MAWRTHNAPKPFNVFFVGGLSGKAKLDFPTKGDFEPTKKPKKIFAPAAQLKNKFILFVVHKIAFCGFKILVGGLSGRPPFPDNPTKKNNVAHQAH